MKLSPANAGKLASLSALGAGALVAGMGQAQAGIIYTDTDGKVGFSTGFGSAFSTHASTSFGSGGFKFHTSRHGTSSSGRRSVKFTGLNGAKFATAGGGLFRLFALGSTTSGAFLGAAGTAAIRLWGKTGTPTASAVPPSFSDRYALFNWTFGTNTYYGWVELSLNNNKVFGTPNGAGPDLTISGWAFDTVPGQPIPAGEVPEPGTLGTTGLAALTLGALGVRRWRNARPSRTA